MPNFYLVFLKKAPLIKTESSFFCYFLNSHFFQFLLKNAAKALTIACKIILPVPGSKYACALVVKIKNEK